MPLPTRPVDGAEIATDWGQEIHDRVLAASGCNLHDSNTQSTGTSFAQLQLDEVYEDPGGYSDAAGDQIVIPTGKEGLYLMNLSVISVNGSAGAGFGTRALIDVNGSKIAYTFEDNDGATPVTVNVVALYYLSAGDQVRAFAQRRGGGTNPDVKVNYFQLLRLTDNYGA